MRKHNMIFPAILCAVIAASFVLPMPTILAQGGDEGARAGSPAGVGILLLLMGIVAILAIGGYYISQNRPQRPKPDGEEEEE